MVTNMAKETMIVFVYDTEYYKDEEEDPINAVLFFHPSWVSNIQKLALCGQLMGTSQFFKYSFFRPKIITLQNGKFVFKEFGRFLVAIGTDRNISDYLLEQRGILLASLIKFFHRDLQNIYDHFPLIKRRRNVSEKLYHVLGAYLPILHYSGIIFQNVPKLRIPKIASNIFLDAMQTLQNFQQMRGILGGAILYHNKIVASQLSDSVTKNIILTEPHRIKSTAELIDVKFHVPVGVKMIIVYIPVSHHNMLSAHAYRSQTVQTQRLSSNEHSGHLQKRKMKSDRSIIFSNIPEENNNDHAEAIEQFTVQPTKVHMPTHLSMKEVVKKKFKKYKTFSEGKNIYSEFIGRTSVCLTPMTENKILYGSKIMPICANLNANTTAPNVIPNSFKTDFDIMFIKFLQKSEYFERRNSFTDLQDSVEISIKKTLSSDKNDKFNLNKTVNIIRTMSDPICHVFGENYTSERIPVKFSHEFSNDSNAEIEEQTVGLNKASFKHIDKNATGFESCLRVMEMAYASNTYQYQLPIQQNSKTTIDKNSLSLPLKTHSDNPSDQFHSSFILFDEKNISRLQLTPLMSKLSEIEKSEDRRTQYSYRSCLLNLKYKTDSDGNYGNQTCFLKNSTYEKCLHLEVFHKVALYICGQQNMTMFLLLEQGSTQSQEIVQTMFDKCVAKLSKMELNLNQTLNVNMMESVCEVIFSMVCLDSKCNALFNHGSWTRIDQSFLEKIRADIIKCQDITDIFLRTSDSYLYGNKSGRTEFFLKEKDHYFTGIPPPSDPIGTIAKRAKSRLVEYFSIVL